MAQPLWLHKWSKVSACGVISGVECQWLLKWHLNDTTTGWWGLNCYHCIPTLGGQCKLHYKNGYVNINGRYSGTCPLGTLVWTTV